MYLFLIICAALVGCDILTKYLITSNMSVGETIPIIDGVFHLTYVKNTGAAFSILTGQRLFLILLPLIIVVALVFYIIVKKPKSKLLVLSFSMIIAGGISNLIDRISLGYVIDFLDFRIINFPVFNFADICVTLGAGLFIGLLLLSKEEVI